MIRLRQSEAANQLSVIKLVFQKQRIVPLKRDQFVLITHLLITERDVVRKLY
ncbi:hypothetical protein [Paraburkholderia sediminicola]|uniref:hypothetical protein n=1 Tax=Paraburkholderia sediminicola TaxID=458836 RepID=UPI0038B875DD